MEYQIRLESHEFNEIFCKSHANQSDFFYVYVVTVVYHLWSEYYILFIQESRYICFSFIF